MKRPFDCHAFIFVDGAIFYSVGAGAHKRGKMPVQELGDQREGKGLIFRRIQYVLLLTTISASARWTTCSESAFFTRLVLNYERPRYVLDLSK